MQTPKMREPISTLSGRGLLNEDTKSTFGCYAMEEGGADFVVIPFGAKPAF